MFAKLMASERRKKKLIFFLYCFIKAEASYCILVII